MVLAVLSTLVWVTNPAPAGAAVGVPDCAWKFVTTPATANVAYPDANATYWTTPYQLGEETSIRIEGTYAQARYFSYNTYDHSGNTIDTARDAQIDPDAGSGNPFADPAAQGLPLYQQRYTATVVRGDPTGPNEIDGVRDGDPAGVGFLILRVYISDDPAEPSGGLELPTLTLVEEGGAETPLPVCSAVPPDDDDGSEAGAGLRELIARYLAANPPEQQNLSLPEGEFVLPATTGGLFPNGDNSYIAARLTYQPDRLVVVRGQAPIIPNTRAGEPVTAPQDLRYWSFCMNDMVTPFPVVACAADYQVAVDASGTYNLVLGADGEVPSSALDDPAVTVIPWGDPSVADKALILRNMLPQGPYAAQSVLAANDSGTEPVDVMGSYYPEATYCEAETYAAGGAAACFDPPPTRSDPEPVRAVIPRFTG